MLFNFNFFFAYTERKPFLFQQRRRCSFTSSSNDEPGATYHSEFFFRNKAKFDNGPRIILFLKPDVLSLFQQQQQQQKYNDMTTQNL